MMTDSHQAPARKLTARRKTALRSLAREIAMDLFTDGSGVQCDRLVQTRKVGEGERGFGGWSIGPATDYIYKHLLRHDESR